MNDRTTPSCCSVVTVDPYRCRVSALSARIAKDVTEASCQAEIDSIARNGQFIPVIGRTLQRDPEFDIEVICGARRTFAARHLNVPLRVELRELTDREAAAAMQAENSRKSTSPYEQGLWFAKLLERNLYRSHDEMARELGITPIRVARLLKFAELPAIVIDAFSTPHNILESWAVELHKACADERRTLLIERACVLEKRVPRPPAVSTYEILMASRWAANRSPRRGVGRAVKSPAGELLLRLERRRNDMVLRIPNALVAAGVEEAVTQAIVAVLTGRQPDQGAASVA